MGTGEMAQQLRTLTALLEVLSSTIPSTHMGSDAIFWSAGRHADRALTNKIHR